MSSTGTWVLRNSAYLKQKIVQETIAEYFALSFANSAKDSIGKSGCGICNGWRDVNRFPEDGGYSGALLIKSDSEYKKIYDASLKDFPSTYINYLAPLVPNNKGIKGGVRP